MKKIKILIIICVLICLFLIVSLVVLSKNKTEKVDEKIYSKIDSVPDNIVKNVNTIELIKTSNCINKFMSAKNKNPNNYSTVDTNGESIKKEIEIEKQIYERVFDMLDENYVKENNINVNNIENHIKFSNKAQEYIIIGIKKIERAVANPIQFITYGAVVEEGNFIEYKNFIVTIDTQIGTFAIQPVEDKTEDIDKVNVKETKVNKENTNNKIPVGEYDQEGVCRFYLNLTKKRLIYDKNYVYELFTKEYIEKRFTNKENLINYINNNKNEITSYYLKQYQVTTDKDLKTQYVLCNQYNNMFIIDAITGANYTAQLDTYTIPTEKFKTTYDSSNEQKKVMMNIDKWVQMLNNRDYTSAYNVLDRTFRESKFGNEENFEKFMREKLPEHYELSFEDFSEENITYVQSILLTPMEKNTENRVKTKILMQLKDNYNYVMSFEC